jgi:hypothetical protein
MGDSNFIEDYLAYIGLSESPTTYHRWCAISSLGAYLGRQLSLPFGHDNLHTNMYMMLIGVAGARKSTAIKISKKIITLAGYEYISADKSSKEKFMLDLAGEDTENVDDILDRNLFGDRSESEYKEMFIACDEFNDFIGNGNIEFISLLGTLWDYDGLFKNRIKTGKSVEIMNPTVSILGGNTQVNFAQAFPPSTLGQGFFSRLLLIYGEPTGRKITKPVPPSAESTVEIVRQMQAVKLACSGTAQCTPTADKLLDKIYTSGRFEVSDGRFDSYNNRRFTHLLKLCLICAAANHTRTITEAIVIYANTILAHTEYLMPKALGEFGKSKDSDVTHKVMIALEKTGRPLTVKDLWTLVHTDLSKINDLTEMLRSLITADKIFNAGGGFLAKRKARDEDVSGTVNYELLTQDEQEMVK